MYQADKLVATQAKAAESAQALAQLAIENAKTIAEIQYDAAKDAVATAQAKASKILSIKDPKEVLEMITAEDAPVVIAEVTAVQSKMTKVIRKTNQEVVEMFESAIDESKADLKKLVKEVSAKAPAGSEAFVNTFDYLIDSTLQTFDQAYLASKEACVNFEKSVDGVMSTFQGQFATATKPAPKVRKAITA
jgi:formate-dependent phosphoribosylglycinamide formyltransferase (GAR transformylase)